MYQKILSVLTILLLTSAFLMTACSTDNAGEAPSSIEQSAGQKASAAANSTEEAETAATADPAAATSAAEPALPDLIQFTVDITDNRSAESGQIIGNTAAENSYSGIITINLDETLAGRAASEIQTGETWIFTVTPMMTRSIPPQVSATDFTRADANDIAQLEAIREAISSYENCMQRYQSEDMSLEDIIQDANTAYATWTQAEIAEYIALITEKGYTDAFPVKSYVSLRENLNGSIYGSDDE